MTKREARNELVLEKKRLEAIEDSDSAARIVERVSEEDISILRRSGKIEMLDAIIFEIFRDRRM